MKKTAVIILNYNGIKLLERFLPSVVENSPNCDVYVADNGSDDGSQAFVKDNFPNVGLLELGGNYGYAGGYNKAVAMVDNEYLCLLNSDVEVSAGWTEAPIKFLEENPDCAACQPKILKEADRRFFEFAGASGGFIDAFGYPFCRGRMMDTIETDDGQYNDVCKIFWASGACFFVRKKDYELYGGLDEKFIAHQEEIDLCWRFNARGRYLAVVPQSVVYHVGGATLSSSNPRKTYLNFRNNLFLLYKNLHAARFAAVFLVRLCLDYLACLVFLLKGNTGDAKAVVKARLDFYKMCSGFKKDRKHNLQLAKLKPSEYNGLYKGSYIFAYYLLGKRRFQDLYPSKS